MDRATLADRGIPLPGENFSAPVRPFADGYLTTREIFRLPRRCQLGAVGATDITGFGFLGHAREMAEASGVTLRFCLSSIPLLGGALELARRRIVSRGAARNRSFLKSAVTWEDRSDPALDAILHDSETSGGLLIALPSPAARALVERLRELGHSRTSIVGEVIARESRPVFVTSGSSSRPS